ncbi:MAG: FAD-binding protein [Bryobacterales bacterium]|nr:FAD-binding protein [Bryobacterales bacterium]
MAIWHHYFSGRDRTMASLGSVTTWDETVDVIIIGFGLAAASAAIEALERDPKARILILEKMPERYGGGNSRVSGQSLMVPKDDVDALVDYQRNLNRANPVPEDMLQAWAKEMIALLPWIRARAEEVGAEMIRGSGFSGYEMVLEFPEYGAGDAVAPMATILPVPSGVWLAFKANIDKRPVDIRYDCPVTDLIQDPDSLEVHGVIAKRDGTPLAVRARRAVIMACGGYENNLQMQRDYCGMEAAYPFGTPGNTGDGIRMLQKAGADMWHMRSKGQPGGLFAAMRVPMYDTVFMRNFYLLNFNWIEVAADGKRFGDETYPYQLTHWKTKVHDHYLDTLHHQVMPVRMIFDETVRANNRLILSVMTWNAVVEDYEWSMDNSAEIEAGWIRRANTIEDLATQIGVDPTVLRASVDEYNRACEIGTDECFGRNPDTLQPIVTAPYYSVEIVPGIVCTSGGGRRNIESEVLTPDDRPIPRLYEAGELGSMFSYLYQNGSYLTEAMISGRAAGRNAVAQPPRD